MPPIIPPRPTLPRPRVVLYIQTFHQNGQAISLLPLIQNPTGLTHAILAAIHINGNPQHLTLNDDPPSHPKFTQMWSEVQQLKAAGIKILGMLGGAAQGSFQRLDGSPQQFETYYLPLRDMLRQYGFQGLDLDVEEQMSLPGIVRLIDRLKADFGPDFIITLAPVATALMRGRPHLSGFDYFALEAARGPSIAWYNAQFYNSWGWLNSTAHYDEVVLRNGWPAEKVVAGMLTNPGNGGSGFVPIWGEMSTVVARLVARHPGFGGVMGWEYFNAKPGGMERPWRWLQVMALSVGMRELHASAQMLVMAMRFMGSVAVQSQGGQGRQQG